eukprot:351697-Chlamydomonas_euryale.AAC.13
MQQGRRGCDLSPPQHKSVRLRRSSCSALSPCPRAPRSTCPPSAPPRHIAPRLRHRRPHVHAGRSSRAAAQRHSGGGNCAEAP